MRGTTAAALALVAALLCGTEPAFAQLPALRDRPLSAAERTRLASLEVNFTRISAQRNTSVAALRTIASSLGQRLTTQDPDQLVRAIDERAQELSAARERITALERDLESMDSMRLAQAVGPLLTAANAAIEAGDLAEAEARLAEAAGRFADARAGLQGRVDQLAGREADVLGQQAALRSSVFDELGAAELYARAAEVAPAADASARWRYRQAQAEALIRHGLEQADFAVVRQGIEVLEREALPLAPRESRGGDWAATQARIGTARSQLGERAQDNATMRSALPFLQAAADATARQTALTDWIARQAALASAQSSLAFRENDETTARQALERFEAAAAAGPLPRDLRRNYGNALMRMGVFGQMDVRAEQSAAVFAAGAEEIDRDDDPHGWALMTFNRGLALSQVAVARNDVAVARQAVEIHRPAVAAVDRARSQVLWARTRTGLGTALNVLGDLEGAAGLPAYREAIELLRPVTEALTLEQAPQLWLNASHALATAERREGLLTRDPVVLQRAAARFGSMQPATPADRAPLLALALRADIADILADIAELSPTDERTARLQTARTATEEWVATARTLENPPMIQRGDEALARLRRLQSPGAASGPADSTR